jgi:hypothetical protein
VVILSSTAVLVGRAPPATRTNRVATPSVAATNAASFVKGR